MMWMKWWTVAFLLVVALTGVDVNAQQAQPLGLLNAYYPAFCEPAPYPTPSCRLVVFREGQRQSSIELPFRLELLAYARSGTALYGFSVSQKPMCVYRIELNPVGITSLACPSGLTVGFGFAVSDSGDRLFVSGQFKKDSGIRCGVFEIRLPDKFATQILGAEDCGSYKFENAWISLSLSPGADQAIAVRHDQLELIDVGGGSSRAIADAILNASWSPDGRWIAARKLHGGTVLIETKNFRKKRSLADSEGQWSPDSRYLLRIRDCLFPNAVNGVGTAQALEIATGKSVTIESSRCLVDSGATGWISSGTTP